MALPSSEEIYKVFSDVNEFIFSKCKLKYSDVPALDMLLGKSQKGLRKFAYSMAKYKTKELLRTTKEGAFFWKKYHRFHSLHDLKSDGAMDSPFVPMIDLAAIPMMKLRQNKLTFDHLKASGIDHVVIMEDRNPLFFLNYKKSKMNQVIPLDRHKCDFDADILPWMEDDLRRLVELFHKSGIKVLIGFWGHIDDNAFNPFIQANRETLCPAIPGSDDLNPLSIVNNKGIISTFAGYVVHQYQHLAKNLGFDGLFLGDGLMGFRNFLTPRDVGGFRFSEDAWELFYQILSDGIREKLHAEIWSFDVMGRNYEDAKKSGVDYVKIMPYLDKLCVQTYGGVAWNKYMKIDGYTRERDAMAMQSIVGKLSESERNKVMYTLEMADTVEGWSTKKSDVQKQVESMSQFPGGKLGVWANEAVRLELG